MKLAAELYLWERIAPLGGWVSIGGAYEFLPSPREVIAAMVSSGMIASPKEAWRTLEKWSPFYDYGVTLDLGWKLGDETPPRLRRGS